MKGPYDKTKRTKRFVLLFAEWWYEAGRKENLSWHEYNTLGEVKEEIRFIKEYYTEEGEKKCGYLVLDYEVEKAILDGGDGYLPEGTCRKFNKDLEKLDTYFRGPNEIPEGYVWDEGEYKGWLQFRWGDGKNAVGWKPPKDKFNKPLSEEEIEYLGLDS